MCGSTLLVTSVGMRLKWRCDSKLCVHRVSQTVSVNEITRNILISRKTY